MSIEQQRFHAAGRDPAPAPAQARRQTDSAPSELERPPHRNRVLFGIASAVLLFTAMLGVLAYHAFKAPALRHVIVVEGGEPWVGVELTVSGAGLPRPHVATVDRTNRFSVPFFLPGGGEYSIVARRGGSELFRTQANLPSAPGTVSVKLPQMPATAPAGS